MKKASAFGKLAAIGGSAASAGGKLAFSGGKLALGAAATGGAMAAQAGASTARAIDDKFKLTSNPKFAAAAAGLSGAVAKEGGTHERLISSSELESTGYMALKRKMLQLTASHPELLGLEKEISAATGKVRAVVSASPHA